MFQSSYSWTTEQDVSTASPPKGLEHESVSHSVMSNSLGLNGLPELCPTLRNPWTAAHQASLPMGFSRQEYWNELPFLSLEDLPDPGIEPSSPALQADSLPSEQKEAHPDSNLYSNRNLLFVCLVFLI